MNKVPTKKMYSQLDVNEIYDKLRIEYGSSYNDNPNEAQQARNILLAALNSGETNPEELMEKIIRVREQQDKPMYVNRFSMQVHNKFWKLRLENHHMIRPIKYTPEEHD